MYALLSIDTKPSAIDGSQAATSSASGQGPYYSSEKGYNNSFEAFQKICLDIENVTDKWSVLRNFITAGSSGTGFTGDLYL